MKKLILLSVFLMFVCGWAYGQKATTENKDIRIRTEDYTLTFLDSPQYNTDIRITATFQTGIDSYGVVVYKKVKDKETPIEIGKFTVYEPLRFQELRQLLSGIAQSKLKISIPLKDEAICKIYFWLYSIAYVTDNTPRSGVLFLRENVFVFDKENQELQNEDDIADYYKRTAKVLRRNSEYTSAMNNLETQQNSLDALTDSLIGSFKKSIQNLTDVKNKDKQTKENEKKSITQKINDIKKIIDDLKKADPAIISKVVLYGDNNDDSTLTDEDKSNVITYKKASEDIETFKSKKKRIEENPADTTKYQVAIVELEKQIEAVKNGSLPPLSKKVTALTGEAFSGKWNDALKKIRIARDTSKKIILKWENSSIYKIDSVDVKFEKGFIEDIKVKITYKGGVQETFSNVYPIGFTSKNNYKALKDVKLFGENSSTAYPFIYLGDVIQYSYHLENYTRDYSPGDTSISLSPSENQAMGLNKERLINLFSSKIYTDLKGLSDKNPNGLVQIDVSKQFNINTKRHQIGKTRNNWGVFNYINISGLLSKIESDKRTLTLRNNHTVINNKLVSPSYATMLDLKQYEYGSIGYTANLLVFDAPNTKITCYIDLGTRYGLTKVQDTVLEVRDGIAAKKTDEANALKQMEAHTLTFFPRFTADVISERRVGFSLSYQLNATYLFSNNDFKPVLSYKKSNTDELPLEQHVRLSHMIEMYLKVETSDNTNNKFFLRARLFLQAGDLNTSYSQIQLGYAYNLFYKK